MLTKGSCFHLSTYNVVQADFLTWKYHKLGKTFQPCEEGIQKIP
jgi:hypothetical protein